MATLKNWLAERGVGIAYYREGPAAAELFHRALPRHWTFETYNTRRPHRSHGMLALRQFAEDGK